MEKQTEKAIRILIYTVVGIIVFSVMIKILFPFVAAASLKKVLGSFNQTVQINKPKIERKIVEQQPSVIKENKVEIKFAKPQQFKGTVYSWTTKEGKRMFSNIGFPKNEEYTNPKMEISGIQN